MNKRVILFDISKISKEDLLKKGIYKITNIKNNNFYIGSASRNFKERFKEHSSYYIQYQMGLLKRKHNPILWNAFNKYGIENFKVEILEVINIENIILTREEYYINILNPSYNICKTPTKGGSPNKNRKLSNNWKNNIKEKSKLYTHSSETLKLVTENNKKNAVKLHFKLDNTILFFNSWIEAANYFNVNPNTLIVSFTRKQCWYKYEIKKLTTQIKQIKVDNMIFLSFNKCDRYFNMWRGYTSTCVKYNRLIMDKYKYELI